MGTGVIDNCVSEIRFMYGGRRWCHRFNFTGTLADSGIKQRITGTGNRRVAPFWIGARQRRNRRGDGKTLSIPIPGEVKKETARQPNPNPMFPKEKACVWNHMHRDCGERIWWGAASNATAVWAAKNGMNLQSSTLKFDENGKPFHIQQAQQIRLYKEAWEKSRTPA